MRIFYRLAGDDVAQLFALLHKVAERHQAAVWPARDAYLGDADSAELSHDDLQARIEDGDVIIANALLGINQGLTWSTTVMMKIDLVGPCQRGLAMGLNKAAGYGAVAVTSVIAGHLAEQHGLRPAPFLLGLSYAALALLLSGVFVRETRDHMALEAASALPSRAGNRQVFADVSWREPAPHAPTLCNWAGSTTRSTFTPASAAIPVNST